MCWEHILKKKDQQRSRVKINRQKLQRNPKSRRPHSTQKSGAIKSRPLSSLSTPVYTENFLDIKKPIVVETRGGVVGFRIVSARLEVANQEFQFPTSTGADGFYNVSCQLQFESVKRRVSFKSEHYIHNGKIDALVAYPEVFSNLDLEPTVVALYQGQVIEVRSWRNILDRVCADRDPRVSVAIQWGTRSLAFVPAAIVMIVGEQWMWSTQTGWVWAIGAFVVLAIAGGVFDWSQRFSSFVIQWIRSPLFAFHRHNEFVLSRQSVEEWAAPFFIGKHRDESMQTSEDTAKSDVQSALALFLMSKNARSKKTRRRIFLSHSGWDADAAMAIAEQIQEHSNHQLSVSCLSRPTERLGMDLSWDLVAKIREIMSGCDAFIFVESSNQAAQRSGWIESEYRLAEEINRKSPTKNRVISVLLLEEDQNWSPHLPIGSYAKRRDTINLRFSGGEIDDLTNLMTKLYSIFELNE